MRYARETRRLDAKRSQAIIEALGGVTAVAKTFGLSHPSVSHWKRDGIPEDRLQVIQLRFKKVPAVKDSLDFHPWTDRV